MTIQTFLNIGGVTNFVPLTGLPLPFISHGGSSLITGFIGIGILLAISDHAVNQRNAVRPGDRGSRNCSLCRN